MSLRTTVVFLKVWRSCSTNSYQNFSLRCKSFLHTECLSLLSVQDQVGVIWCISSFWRPFILDYFWLKYSRILVLLILCLTGILLSSEWPSRVSRPLGLLFLHSDTGYSFKRNCYDFGNLSYICTKIIWSILFLYILMVKSLLSERIEREAMLAFTG